MKKWNLNSWTKYPAKHLPEYKDKKELDLVLSKINKRLFLEIREKKHRVDKSKIILFSRMILLLVIKIIF